MGDWEAFGISGSPLLLNTSVNRFADIIADVCWHRGFAGVGSHGAAACEAKGAVPKCVPALHVDEIAFFCKNT